MSLESVVMPERLQLPRPIVGAAAGFHANVAGRQAGKEGQYLCALGLLLHHGLAFLVCSMHLLHVPCQIYANRRKFHIGRPFHSSG
jgi:hypothetical protein